SSPIRPDFPSCSPTSPLLFSLTRRPPRSSLFPYTTLFRSHCVDLSLAYLIEIKEILMSTVTDTLNEVSAQIDADPLALAEARTRLNLVLEIAASYDGQLATYRSGSLAAHTMIDPVSDGDGGLILDRRSHPDLGPEGRGETPLQIVEELRSYMAPVIRKTYPKARVTTSKRGP